MPTPTRDPRTATNDGGAAGGAPKPEMETSGDHATGFLKGVEPHLDEKLAPTVSEGAARPLAPGEYVMMEPGKSDNWASEMTMTVQREDGKWVNVPSLWIKDGKPYAAATPEEALDLAEGSGLDFIAHDDAKTAEQSAVEREAGWQDMKPADAGKVAPLWAKQAAAAKVNPHIYLPDINVYPDPLQAVKGLK